jgi:hypothetical protein
VIPTPLNSRHSGEPAARTDTWFIDTDEYAHLCRIRREHVVPVREPLVLISQIQRSGGSLLSQLFDGHPECHAHPHELHVGYPEKHNWPPLDLAAPATWFPMLFEKQAGKHLKTGYRKSPSDERFPFLFLPKLQRSIFADAVAARPINGERDVLDCYMTSYFNAWLDNQNFYSSRKRVVTAFAPRLSMDLANVDRFFTVYPDGTLISIVRDPRAWYASARTHAGKFSDFDRALGMWCQSADAAIDASERYRERVLLLTYEGLVLETEGTMQAVADRIGVTMSPVLLAPTFNCCPIRANSTHSAEQHGILAERTTTYRGMLDVDTISRIDRASGDLYERAAALASA